MTSASRVKANPIDAVATAEPARVFSQSMLISTVRCTLSYLVFPFVLPLVGITSGIDSGVGVVVGMVAIAANLFSIHRFWSSDHRYKVHASVLNVAVIAALAVLLLGDLVTVFG